MLLPIRQLRQRAAWYLRRLQVTAAGGAMFAIAVAFLTASLWMAISEELSPIMASLIVGALFGLAGRVVMSLRRTPRAPTVPTRGVDPHREAAAGSPHEMRALVPPLVEAFLLGAFADLQLRDRLRR